MWKRIQAWRMQESGIAIGALAILMMPVFIGAFGYGVDSARAIYAKEVIQGRLDLAVQAATTAPPGAKVLANGNFLLDPTLAPQTAKTLYKTNTASLRPHLLLCAAGVVAPTSSTAPTTMDQKCSGYARVVGTQITYAEANSGLLCTSNLNQDATRRYGVAYVVYESVPTMFMRIVGTQSMPLGRVRAESLVRAANC